LLTRHCDRHHVALEELAKVNAGVEAAGDQVAPDVVLAGDVEDHLGIVAGEFLKPWTQERRQHHRGRDQADDAGRLFAESTDLGERSLDVVKRGTQLRQPLLSWS